MKTGLFAILNTAITKNFSNNDKRVTVLTADSSKEQKNMRKGKSNYFKQFNKQDTIVALKSYFLVSFGINSFYITLKLSELQSHREILLKDPRILKTHCVWHEMHTLVSKNPAKEISSQKSN